MTNEFIKTALQREFPEEVFVFTEPYGMLTVEVDRGALKKVIHHMKDSSLNFMFLTDLCGVHYPENKEKEIGVVYHLHNLMDNLRVRIKSFTSIELSEFDSVTDLYAGANWMERETFDFYGIKFKGHPDLRRILNVEDMDYHPMLKQYRLEDATRTDKDDKMFGR